MIYQTSKNGKPFSDIPVQTAQTGDTVPHLPFYKYFTFDTYPKIDDVAVIALQLIMNEPDALKGYNDLKDYLKVYDECRFKFSEMSKAINVNDNDN